MEQMDYSDGFPWIIEGGVAKPVNVFRDGDPGYRIFLSKKGEPRIIFGRTTYIDFNGRKVNWHELSIAEKDEFLRTNPPLPFA